MEYLGRRQAPGEQAHSLRQRITRIELCPPAVSIASIQGKAHIVSVPRIPFIRILGSIFARNTKRPNSTKKSGLTHEHPLLLSTAGLVSRRETGHAGHVVGTRLTKSRLPHSSCYSVVPRKHTRKVTKARHQGSVAVFHISR